ncbi:MAG: type II secretion system protein N [Gammaproteobacteria bacterium]
MRQAISIKQQKAQAAVVSLITLSAVVLLSLVLAHWTWIWFAPRSEVRAREISAEPRDGAAYGLFGNSQQSGKPVAQTGIAVRLLGLVAATAGNTGYAVLKLEAKEVVAVRQGEEIAPGVRLEAVNSDHVILERGGMHETLTWPAEKATTPSISP